MVVSLMKDRLSPKSDPPTMTAVINGMLVPVCSATPAAIGVSATMVPTLVPTLSEMKQAATKRPASNMFPGNSVRARLTVASVAPIVLAELAKALKIMVQIQLQQSAVIVIHRIGKYQMDQGLG